VERRAYRVGDLLHVDGDLIWVGVDLREPKPTPPKLVDERPRVLPEERSEL